MSDWPSFETVSKILGSTFAVIAGLFGIRRYASRDRSAIHADRAGDKLLEAYGTLAAKLKEDRDAAMKAAEDAWSHRTADREQIARLEAQALAHTMELERVQAQLLVVIEELRIAKLRFYDFRKMMLRKFPEVVASLGSDFAPLDD